MPWKRHRVRAVLSIQVALAVLLLIWPMPPAFAGEAERRILGQDICNILPSAGRSVWDSDIGCRWIALPERQLVRGEVVELFIRHSSDEAVRQAIDSGHRQYADQMARTHLFTRVTELNPCSENPSAGRTITVYHAKFVEVFGYAQCHGQTISVKVHLDKNGGTSPSDVFDALIRGAVPLLARKY